MIGMIGGVRLSRRRRWQEFVMDVGWGGVVLRSWCSVGLKGDWRIVWKCVGSHTPRAFDYRAIGLPSCLHVASERYHMLE